MTRLLNSDRKTTAAGVGAILAGVVALIGLFTGESTPEDAWPLIREGFVAAAAILAGLGLVGARDKD